MRIINNLNGRSHWDALVAKTRAAAHITIVSPFTDEILLDLIRDETGPQLRSITVITRLYDTPPDAHATASRLLRILDFASTRPQVEVQIHENPRLHGKIYLTRSGQNFTYGLLGSANCTHFGLIRNHEWSVEIDDAPTLDALWSDVLKSLPRSVPLERAALENIVCRAKQAVDANREAIKAVKTLRLPIESMLPPRKRTHVGHAPVVSETGTVWLKPVGDSKNWISVSDDYWSDQHDLHFSKRPVGIAIGHKLVAYATGWKKLVGLFEIISVPRQLTDIDFAVWPEGKRWPWSIKGRALTPHFSQRWPAEELRLESLINSFVNLSVSSREKEKARNIKGALQFGSDKVRLEPVFAQYVIDEFLRREGIE